MKKLFIGIDFSKLSFDVSVLREESLEDSQHLQFENSKEGYTHMMQWVKSQTTLPKEQWIFCGEHTGLCSVGLSSYLIQKKDVYLVGKSFTNKAFERNQTREDR